MNITEEMGEESGKLFPFLGLVSIGVQVGDILGWLLIV